MNGDEIVDKAIRQIVLDAFGGKVSNYENLVQDNEMMDYTYNKEYDDEEVRGKVRRIRERANYAHKF